MKSTVPSYLTELTSKNMNKLWCVLSEGNYKPSKKTLSKFKGWVDEYGNLYRMNSSGEFFARTISNANGSMNSYRIMINGERFSIGTKTPYNLDEESQWGYIIQELNYDAEEDEEYMHIYSMDIGYSSYEGALHAMKEEITSSDLDKEKYPAHVFRCIPK